MSSAKTILKEFSISSSFHGIKNLTEYTKVIPKLIWSLILLLLAYLCAYGIISTICNYLKFEVASNSVTSHENSITFPAVSICYKNENLTIDNTLVRCQINNDKCDASSFFKVPWSIDNYNMSCYTINQGKFSNGSKTEVVKVYNTYPLELVFYLNNTKYPPAGLNFMIHSQKRYPTSSSIFQVPSGNLY